MSTRFTEPTGAGRETVVAAVRDSFLDEHGCGSDMQDALPEWDESGRVITFSGEGSIDVEHIVSDVFLALARLDGEARP